MLVCHLHLLIFFLLLGKDGRDGVNGDVVNFDRIYFISTYKWQ